MNLNVGEMHSDLEQNQRDAIMHEFRNGRISMLVATDIVARGIDIDDIRLVINYDVPNDSEDYVHRIGRTARANNDGCAITFVSETEQSKFKQIENFLEKISIRFLFLTNWEKLRNMHHGKHARKILPEKIKGKAHLQKRPRNKSEKHESNYKNHILIRSIHFVQH